MLKLYTLAFALATVTMLACSAQHALPPDVGDGGEGGSGGAGGLAGSGGFATILCDCSLGPQASSCEALCAVVGATPCESPCGECVETEGEGRRAFVCNDMPGGITVYFNADGKPHVCDGYTSDHCLPGTDCAAFSDGGMLVGTCL